MAEPIVHKLSKPAPPRITEVILRATTKFNAVLPDGTLSAERVLTEDTRAIILDLGEVYNAYALVEEELTVLVEVKNEVR